ncbi:MAG TPA: restriction endonuclease PLD domain-containing protein, partial [Allosphingosinicella sp.]
MLHSKVYLFDRHDGHARAYIGSHNLTGYALNGLNGEASVSIESLSDDPALQDVRAHVEAAAAEAVQYDPAQRDAYAWWSLQSAEGLADKFRDAPRDGESVRTIVIIAEAGDTPAQGDTVYLELPEGLGRVQSLRAEVHLFLFDHLPETPSIALSMLHSAKRSVWCRTVGIEDDRGGRELLADWYLDLNPSRLRRAQRPFRPTPGQGMQQVRVQAYKEVRGEFEYLFDDGKAKFEPVYD